MAYFSNGSEGDLFDARNCNQCVNEEVEDRKPPGCPVMLLHLLWNYEQHNTDPVSKAKRTALDILIPDPGPGIIPTCPMLVRKETP